MTTSMVSKRFTIKGYIMHTRTTICTVSIIIHVATELRHCFIIFADPTFHVSSGRDHAKESFKAHTSVDRIVR